MRLPANGQIKGDNGKLAFPWTILHITEEGRGYHMYASECQFFIISFPVAEILRFHFSGGFIYPTVQVIGRVEQEIPGSLTLADQ